MIDLRPARGAEFMYARRTTTEVLVKSGFIGDITGIFGGSGKLYPTWNNFQEQKRTPSFRAELEQLITALRESLAFRKVLSSFEAMLAYCRAHPEAKMESDTVEYAFRIDAESYVYMLRLVTTDSGDPVNLMAYEKKWFDLRLKNAAKGIRFIDSHYKDKFRAADGDLIRIRFADGTTMDQVVRYIDDTHIELCSSGYDHSNLYHICEFAERMERGNCEVIPLRRSLPDQCYTTIPSSGEIIVVKKGESGYYHSDLPDEGAEANRVTVDGLNKQNGVSKAQEAAMAAGSMFGWHVPAADPANYDEAGNMKGAKK